MIEDPVTVYHNPRCSKSRAVLALLEERGIPARVVEYLKHPPGHDEIRRLLGQLGMSAGDLVRRNEAVCKEQFGGRDMKEPDWLQALVDFPILIERPIVVVGSRAVVARPPERVLDILAESPGR